MVQVIGRSWPSNPVTNRRHRNPPMASVSANRAKAVMGMLAILFLWLIIVMVLYPGQQSGLVAAEDDRGQFWMAAGGDAIDVLAFEPHMRPLLFRLLHQHAK